MRSLESHGAGGRGTDGKCKTRGKREAGQISQRTKRDRCGGRAKEEINSPEVQDLSRKQQILTVCG